MFAFPGLYVCFIAVVLLQFTVLFEIWKCSFDLSFPQRVNGANFSMALVRLHSAVVAGFSRHKDSRLRIMEHVRRIRPCLSAVFTRSLHEEGLHIR